MNIYFLKDKKKPDTHRRDRIFLRAFIMTLIGLIFFLSPPFVIIAQASDSPPPTEVVATESDQQRVDSDPEIISDKTENVQVDSDLESAETSEDETLTAETEKAADPANEDEGLIVEETNAADPEITVELPTSDESALSNEEATSEDAEEDPVVDEGALPEGNQEPPTDESNNNEVDIASEEAPNSITVPDPYFFVNGNKHSFFPEGGDCTDVDNCQVSATPIQDALDAISGGLTPDDHTIYIEGGIYKEDVTINEMSDLTLQGAANEQPSTLAGAVSVSDSINISLRDLIFQEIIQISNSSDVTIQGTEGDDEIEIVLDGTVENLSVEGGAGSDSLTVNADADIDLGQLESQVNLDENLEVVNINVEGSGNEVKIEEELNIPGGQVTINNPDGDVIVSSSGEIDVSNDDAGEIEINADRIASFGSLTSDGQGDGGRIHLLANDMLVIGNDAKLTANATLNGNGGEILAIAEKHAAIASSAILQAKGGSLSGNGGFIETSGYQSFDIGTIPNVSSEHGHAGEWLLDPYHNIEVVTGSTNTNITQSGGNFTSNNDTAQIGVDNIKSALNGGNDVTITTAADSGSSESGNVSWNASLISYTATAERTLKVVAMGNITVSQEIRVNDTTGAGKLTVHLVAGGDINFNGQFRLFDGGDATLKFEAKNDINYTMATEIGCGTCKIHAQFIADSDNDGSGKATISHNLYGNGGDVLIQGSDIDITAGVIDPGAGNITLQPSTIASTIAIGDGPVLTGTFKLSQAELTTRLNSTGTLTIGRSDGTGKVEIGDLDVSGENFNLIIRGGEVQFKGTITVHNDKVLQVISNDDIKGISDGTTPDVYFTSTASPGKIILDSKNGVGTNAANGSIFINPDNQNWTTLSAQASLSGGVFINHEGKLDINSIAGWNDYGIEAKGGGITIIASSPLRVSKAIRENAGGDINLTAGNDSTKLGDDLTIEADVTITGSTGRITGNAGDDIKTETSTNVSAPEGVNFNADLDGNADNGGGTATISGTVQATNRGAAVNINGANGVNLTASGKIITNGGNATLSAANGTVTQTGTINLNGGTLTVIEKPPDPVIAGVTVFIDPDTGEVTITAADADSAAAAAVALALAANPVLTVASGQPVDLLTATAFGESVALQLPEGNGATFVTGIDATVTMTSGAEVVLPAELPEGFDMLDSLEIAVDTELTDDELGGILVSFGLPADTPLEELVILQYVEGEGWVEVPLEESLNGLIEGLTETGGVFVLAQGSAEAEAEATADTGNGSAQATLSGNTNEPVILELNQGNQITVTGGAGDAVSAVDQIQENLPGDLPSDLAFLSGLSVDVTQGVTRVSILPNGEGIEVSFDVPEGGSPQDVVILYWLDVLNGGQGGWQELTPEITPDGRVTLQTFFGGTFVLANR